MLIKSVELKNIKSYSHETIEFMEGINGICGHNGHGKTTILEAIGYVLFDYLPYKESDFLRHGEKSGFVSVEVLANGSSFRLTRKLGGECSVRGADTDIKGKKDVLAWLANNLQVSEYNELPGLFENAVGVPQGLLTAAFMETPSKRKKTFDEILRVEEYRNAYENLRSTMNLIDESVKNMENDIDKLRIRIENYEKKKDERADLYANIENTKKELKESSNDLDAAKKTRDSLKKQKVALDLLESELKQMRIKADGLKQMLEKSKIELKRSEEAQKTLKELSSDKERYEEEKKKQVVLEVMRQERDILKDRLSKINNELVLLNEKKSRLDALKTETETYAKERATLIPQVEKQAELEKIIEAKKGDVAVAKNEIKDIKGRMSSAGEGDICPVMKGVKCNSVKDFSSYFRQQLSEAQNRLDASESSLASVDSQLKALGDTRSKVNTIALLIKKGNEESQKIIKEVSNIPEKERAAGKLKESLDKYNTLDIDISELKKRLVELEPIYHRCMQNEALAARFAEFKNEYERLERTIAEEENKLKELQKRHAEAESGFNAGELARTESVCEELAAKVRGYEVLLREKNGQLQKLDKELTEMKSYLAKIGELESKLENEKRFGEYAKFIRETLHDSAQHIVLELIGEISEEANSLYCAIMDDFSQELRWSEDYGIMITESGEEKNFYQLSGGEKMGAALALRLALLKMLSNSDFVFLDEPTQNMDEIRRENLSEQIMNIKGFKQIFVISHDDTFNEKYGHVVKIEKQNGESKVVKCST